MIVVVSKVSFYRGGAKAQRNKVLIVYPLRLSVSAVILYKLSFETTSAGEEADLTNRHEHC